MSPSQRAAAERLIDEYIAYDEVLDWPAEAAALLRELLAAEPAPEPAQKKPSTASQFESVKEAKKVAEAQLSYYRKMMADKSAEPDEDAQYRCGGPGCDGNCCQPVQEPVIWIQSNHLQHAKNGPYLARTGPTKLMSDFLPLYAHPPQQRKPLTHMQAVLLWGHRSDGPSTAEIVSFARAVEKAHGITGEQK